MSRILKVGSTSRSVLLRALDATTGAPVTSFAYNDAGISLWYKREGGTMTAITPASLAAEDSAWSSGGVKYVADGVVRIDVPDAAFASGAKHVEVCGSTTAAVLVKEEIDLVAYDPDDAVRHGLTALPNAAADAAGGLPISDAGALDLDARLGKLADAGFTAVTYAADLDDYRAKVWLNQKSTATATDRWTVFWYKNGARVTSGITNAKIQVIKRDGSDLVALANLTEIGTTHFFKKDETANLVVPGESYIVVLTATIDGSTRTDEWPQGRDV